MTHYRNIPFWQYMKLTLRTIASHTYKNKLSTNQWQTLFTNEIRIIHVKACISNFSVILYIINLMKFLRKIKLQHIHNHFTQIYGRENEHLFCKYYLHFILFLCNFKHISGISFTTSLKNNAILWLIHTTRMSSAE